MSFSFGFSRISNRSSPMSRGFIPDNPNAYLAVQFPLGQLSRRPPRARRATGDFNRDRSGGNLHTRDYYQGNSFDDAPLEPPNKRATWAEAEMFVAYNLSIGYSEEGLENFLKDKVETFRETGEFDPLFLEFCLRILFNMQNARQNPDLTKNLGQGALKGEGANQGVGDTDGRSIMSVDVVSRLGKDKEIARQLDECQCLDKETEARLRQMRRNLHKEAERVWHENAAKELHDEDRYQNTAQSARSGRIHSPSPISQKSKRVEFPYEPTMTESSLPGHTYDPRSHLSSVRNQQDFGSRISSRPASTVRNIFPKIYDADSSDSIAPGDSVSQYESNFDANAGADYSRLRLRSPPNISNESQVDFTSGAFSGYISGRNQGRVHTPRWGTTRERSAVSFRDSFKQLRITADHPTMSGGVTGLHGGEQSGVQSNQYTSGPELGSRSDPSGTHGRRGSVSKGRMVIDFRREDLLEGSSTDSGSTIIPGRFPKPRANESEERGGQYNPYEGLQDHVYDRSSGPGYRLDLGVPYESRHPSDLLRSGPSRPVNDMYGQGPGSHEASNISSSGSHDWSTRAALSHNVTPRSRGARSPSRHHFSKHSSRFILVGDPHKSREGIQRREDAQRQVRLQQYGRAYAQSPLVGTNYMPPTAETITSTTSGYTSRGKHSKKSDPLKRKKKDSSKKRH